MKHNLQFILCLMMFCGWSISGYTQDLKYEWGVAIGGSDLDLSRGIAVDEDGNSYATGTFNNVVNFNPQGSSQGDTLRSVLKNGDNLGDAFVYKLNPAGQLAWIKRFKNTTGQGWAVKVDKNKNVYVTGDFTNKADFNPGESPADTFFLSPIGGGGAQNSDIFVVKLDSAGSFVWARNFGSNKWEQCFGMALDDQDNILVTGHFTGTADFDLVGGNQAAKITSLNSNFSYNSFVLKLRSNGDFVWVKGILGKGSSRGQGVTADQFGNVYAVGEFFDSISLNPARKYYQLGTGTFNTKGNYDSYIVKLDSSGNYIWGHTFGGDKEDRSNDVAVDRKGGFVYSVHEIKSNGVDFGVPNKTTILKGFTDVVLLKMDLDGNSIWAKNYGGFYSTTYGKGMAVDSRRGNIYISGSYSFETNFNPGDQASDTFLIRRPFGGQDPYVVQIDNNGDFGWAKSFPNGIKNGLSYGVDIDPMGSIYTTGYFQGDSIDLDGGSNLGNTAFFKNKGSYDFYVLKMSCQGSSTATLELTLDCNQPVFTYHGVDYSETGVYTQILVNAAKCDSIVTLNLTFRTMPPPFITVSGFNLGTTGTYSTYQWLLNGTNISGATNSIYTVRENGDYSVVVSNDEGCIDTSDVYVVNNQTGIDDIGDLAKYIRIYPNPTSNIVYIQAPIQVNLTLNSIVGKTIRELRNVDNISLKDLSSGIYLLEIRDKNNTLIKVEKIVKE